MDVEAELLAFLAPAGLSDADRRELASRLLRAKVTPRLLVRDASLLHPTVLKHDLGLVEPGFRVALGECYAAASGRRAPDVLGVRSSPDRRTAPGAHTPRSAVTPRPVRSPLGVRTERRVGAPLARGRPATAPRAPPPSARLASGYASARRPTSPLRGVPLRVALGAPYAPHCSATGAGLLGAVAGTPSHVLVVTRDVDNARLVGGGAVLRAHMLGPAHALITSRDLRDGTYDVAFSCAVSGVYALRVTLTSMPPSGEPAYEEHIRGSPFRIVVHDARSRALRYALLAGERSAPLDGAPRAEARAGSGGHDEVGDAQRADALPRELVVIAGEALALSIGGHDGGPAWPGERFEASLALDEPSVLREKATARLLDFAGGDIALEKAHAPVDAHAHARVVETREDGGGYKVEMSAHRAGEYSLAVSLAGVHVGGSPVAVTVRPARAHAPSTLLSGMGLYRASAGEVAVVRAVARDAFGNACEDGGASIVLRMAPQRLVRVGGERAASGERAAGGTAMRAGSAVDSAEAGDKSARADEASESAAEEEDEAVADERVAYEVDDLSDGGYVLRYSAQRAGTYLLTVALDGADAGTQHRVLVTAGQTDARRSRALGGAVRLATAGQRARVTLRSYDRCGNARRVGGDSWYWALVARPAHPRGAGDAQPRPAVVALEGFAADLDDGRYEVAFTTDVAGAHALELRLGGADGPLLAGALIALRVLPSVASASMSELAGAGLRGARAGAVGEIVVVSRDALGNVRMLADSADGMHASEAGRRAPGGIAAEGTADDRFRLLLTRHPTHSELGAARAGAPDAPGGAELDAAESASRSLGDGRHVLTYRATRAGVYELRVLTEHGGDVAGSPRDVVIDAAAPHAPLSALAPAKGVGVDAEGGAWRARALERCAVMLQSSDRYGNRLLRGGAHVVGVLRAVRYAPPARAPPRAHPARTSASGARQPGGAPAPVRSTPSPARARASSGSGARGATPPLSRNAVARARARSPTAPMAFGGGRGASPAHADAGAGAMLERAHERGDHQGEEGGVDDGDDEGDVVVLGVRDLRNGNYELSCVPQRAGPHELEVALLDDDDDDLDDDDALPSLGRGARDGARNGTNGEHGWEKRQALGPSVRAGLEAAAGHGDAAPRRARVARAVRGSPWAIAVDAGSVSAAHCVVHGSGLLEATAGVCASFEIVPCDAVGNACQPDAARDAPVVRVLCASEPAHASLEAADGYVTVTITIAAARFDAPARYVAQYTPTRAVNHQLSVSVGGVPLPNSPWLVEVAPGAPNARASRLAHRAGRAAVRAGERAEFSLVLCDAFGNACSVSSAQRAAVSASVVGPGEASAVCERGSDARWSISACMTRAGEYAVQALIRGEELGEPSVRVLVEPACTWPPACTILESVEPGSAVRIGNYCNLTLCARDTYGNQRLDGGERVEASVMPAPLDEVAVRDNGDGTYDVRFSPAVVGECVVRVSINGDPIGASPHLVPVRAGAASARHSSAFGKALVGVLVNELASFFVQARDAAGNALHAGGDVADVLIAAGAARVVDLRDQGNGMYHCALIAFEPGALDVHVRLNGAHVGGSPFNVRVIAARI
ncbi:hypothetical protein KFE25_009603 [Diacronema lutheri]|uniref:Uncharacterized protein n=1 Tax=Diacronema lutheri TaxID=2081491 RepID=A0A8J5XZ56_DIALT|nr:hypothetical protein KFE25_009603 [Diacronema lutheri]